MLASAWKKSGLAMKVPAFSPRKTREFGPFAAISRMAAA